MVIPYHLSADLQTLLYEYKTGSSRANQSLSQAAVPMLSAGCYIALFLLKSVGAFYSDVCQPT